MARPKTKLPAELIGQTLVIESPEPLKFLGVEDGNFRVGSYAIRFSNPDQKDLTGEYFTAKTDFGPRNGDGVATMFNHGVPLADGLDYLAQKTFAPVKTIKDDIGIFVETVLNLADEYEAAISELVNHGKLKWSSGTAYHLARKSTAGEILRWHPIEFSYTPTPAESRLPAIMPLKSLLLDDEEADQFTNTFNAALKSSVVITVGDEALTHVSTQMETKTLEELKNTVGELEHTITNNLNSYKADLAEKDTQIAEIAAKNAELTETIASFNKEKEANISEGIKARTKEINEMYALGYQFGNVKAAGDFVEQDKTVADFRVHLMDVLKAHPVALDLSVMDASSIVEQMQAIKDPAARTEFYLKNAEAIHIANRELKTRS